MSLCLSVPTHADESLRRGGVSSLTHGGCLRHATAMAIACDALAAVFEEKDPGKSDSDRKEMQCDCNEINVSGAEAFINDLADEQRTSPDCCF